MTGRATAQRTTPPQPPPQPPLRAPAPVWGWRLVGVLLLAASAWPVLRHYLVDYPGELWQLDLEVYRDGARNLATGYPVYDWLTGAPQFLPFTYPPFAAVLGRPFALVSFTAAGWAWSVLQLVLLWVCTGLAFRPFLARFGARAGLAQGAVAAVLVQTVPVQDGIRYGQVNAVIVALCLADLARRGTDPARTGQPGRPRPADRLWPRGALVGLAAAIKLTPAAFWLHFAVAGRLRALAVSLTAAASATLITAAVAPSASLAYWFGALTDPERLGPNDDPANQSLRGALLRVAGPGSTASTLLWGLLVVAVLGLGLALARRLDRLGDQVAVVAAVGMVAVLVSPVSWVHHYHWGIVVVGALLGAGRWDDARGRARVVLAVAAAAFLLGRWPATGTAMIRDHADAAHQAWGLVLQQSYTLFAVVTLAALWALTTRRARLTRSAPAQPLTWPDEQPDPS